MGNQGGAYIVRLACPHFHQIVTTKGHRSLGRLSRTFCEACNQTYRLQVPPRSVVLASQDGKK